jgi:hypothetical protein
MNPVFIHSAMWTPVKLLVAALLLSGCAAVENVGWTLASSTLQGQMQVSGQRLEGSVRLRPDRTGDLNFSGTGNPARCAGALRFTRVNAGAVDMRCSDGAVFGMEFVLVNEVKGYAFGQNGEATVALTFGMDATESSAYLARANTPANP